MCDFKVGDEVVAVDDDGGLIGELFEIWLRLFNPDAGRPDFGPGQHFIVRGIEPHPHITGLFGVDVDGTGLYPHFSFRKVIRRDLSAWLQTSTDFEEPRRVPVEVDA